MSQASKSPLSRAAVLLTVLLAACAETDEPLTLPTSHGERARDLQALATPPLRSQSREEFAADAQKSADEDTDDEVQRQHDTYGRLGFYPPTFDLRGSAAEASGLYVAYYSTETKAVTVVGSPDHSTLVHEVVHALQDQHFDLRRLHDGATSSDESLARSALIEGDATMAEYRDLVWDRREDPIAVLRPFVTLERARQNADELFAESKLPLLLSAHAAFAYTFGAVYVASELFLPSKQWDYKRVNALLAGEGPRSTQEILRAGAPVDDIVPTGLAALPGAFADEWVIESVDRMGEWYTYVLLYPSYDAHSLLPSSNDRVFLPAHTAAWDGDQLLVLRKKDGSSPPSASSPSGVVWTTAWDDAAAASWFASALTRLHTGGPGDPVSSGDPESPVSPDSPGSVMRSTLDGEEIWLERRGSQVCFVKNLAPDMAAALAHAALYTTEERRLEVLRRTVSKPAIVH